MTAAMIFLLPLLICLAETAVVTLDPSAPSSSPEA